MSRVNNIFSTYENIYFCWEGEGSLERRRAVYSEYKRNRDEAKKEPSYELMKNFIPAFQEMLTGYPCKSIRVAKCEGDDVIYTLAERFYQDHEVLIISTDNDLSQIRERFGENVSMYNPVMKKFIIKENVILSKAIIGDKGDNIPGISGIGAKTFEKMMLDEAFFEETLNKKNNRMIMEQFLEIVDLSKLPEDLKKQINLEAEKNFNKFDPDKIEQFFWNNKAKELVKRWGSASTKIIMNTEE
jgi:DNA polymerase-1